MKIMKSMAAIVLLGIIVAGCGGKGSSVDSAVQKPTISFTTEIRGTSATLHIQTNMKLAPERIGHARKAGEGHIHVSLDGGEKITVSEPVYTLKDLSKGQHKVNVSLHNNDHTPYEVGQSQDFEVK